MISSSFFLHEEGPPRFLLFYFLERIRQSTMMTRQRLIPVAVTILLMSLGATSLAFSRPALALHNNRVNPNFQHPRSNQRQIQGVELCSKPSESSHGSSSSGGPSSTSNKVLSPILFRLNASTKWIVTIANTLAVWTRPHRYEGPFIVFGSLMAVYFTSFLKKVINQGRPDGAPFTDPGMPSSHSLTCFFIASAWNFVLLSSSLPSSSFRSVVPIQGLVWAGAAGVALLRVVCGYHSWAQIGVGAGLGSLLGSIWAGGGRRLYQLNPTTTFYTFWMLYVAGAALFISKNMKDWVTHEKHL